MNRSKAVNQNVLIGILLVVMVFIIGSVAVQNLQSQSLRNNSFVAPTLVIHRENFSLHNNVYVDMDKNFSFPVAPQLTMAVSQDPVRDFIFSEGGKTYYFHVSPPGDQSLESDVSDVT